jgi:uncharacterized protein
LVAVRSEVFYADVRGGRRFCIFHQPGPAVASRGAVLYAHAFAEEMNKSRRTVAVAARALAASGWSVLLVDLEGCGDSSGEFGEATWHGWVDDLLCAERWLADRAGGMCWLWGLRAGCLVAAEAGARLGGRYPLLLWQPVLSGRLHLTQFLRLKLAGEAIGQSEERTGVKALRARLAEGTRLEIAGYTLNPSLAAALESADLSLDCQAAPVVWCEIGTEAEPGLAPGSQVRVDGLRARGVGVDVVAISGPPFWHTVEIAEAPALVAATTRALARFDVATH